MLATHPSAIMSLESRGWKSKTEGSLPCLGLVSPAWCVVSFSPELSVQPGDGISNILTIKGWWCVCICVCVCVWQELSGLCYQRWLYPVNLRLESQWGRVQELMGKYPLPEEVESFTSQLLPKHGMKSNVESGKKPPRIVSTTICWAQKVGWRGLIS